MIRTIKKITFFINAVAQYDVLHYFRESLAAAFRRQGVQVSFIDIYSHTPSSLIKELYADYPDYTFSFNELELQADGSYLSDELHIPHVSWFVDSAHYFYAPFYSSTNVFITPDQKSAELLKEWGAEHAFFLPHAFDKELVYTPESPRNLPIVFCGTLIDPLEVEELWKSYLPNDVRNSLVEAAFETLSTSYLSYQNAFNKVQEKHAVFFQKLSANEIAAIVKTFDSYIRAKDRVQLLQALEGLPIHIFGKSISKRSWQDFLDLDHGNYTIHPPVNFPEALGIMKNAQIVLNSSPMFKTGAHERIFYGLGLGAAVLTNETVWSRTQFTEEELLFYSSRDPKNIYNKIEQLLVNPRRLQEIAAKGQAKVMEQHTWDNRVEELLNYLEQIGLHRE